MRLFASTFWFGAGVAVFNFVHHLAAIIPLFMMSNSIVSFQRGRNYTKLLINKVVLSPDKTSVMLHSVSGHVYDCLVE